MQIDSNGITDEVIFGLGRGRPLASRLGIVGHGVAVVIGPDGIEKQRVFFENLVTTVGDEYYVRRAAAGIGTPNIAQPTLLNGMKLGTGTNAVHKSAADQADIQTYLAGSNKTFTTTHPTVAAKGSDTGWRLQYRCDWAAGQATNAALAEVVLVTDAASDAASAASATIARALLSPTVNKGANDTLYVAWNHDFLGA